MANSRSGKSYPGVICAQCGASVRIIYKPDQVPARFSKRCPKCHVLNTYEWTDIHIFDDRQGAGGRPS